MSIEVGQFAVFKSPWRNGIGQIAKITLKSVFIKGSRRDMRVDIGRLIFAGPEEAVKALHAELEESSRDFDAAIKAAQDMKEAADSKAIIAANMRASI